MNNVQSGSQEHEGELHGLGNTSQEGAQGNGQQDAGGNLLLLVLGGVVHGQGSTGQTEHHDGEEASLVHTGLTQNAAFHGAPELADIVDAGNVKPEHAVQSVVHADGDQQTVQEAVDAGAHSAQTQHALANPYQEAVHNGPYEVQGDADHQSGEHGHDGHETTARKEAQEVGHVGLVELVVAPGSDQAAQDTDELVVDLGERRGNGGVSAQDQLHHSGAEHGLHGQPGNDGSQCRGTFLILGHADGYAQSEQNGHVVDQDAASLNEQQSQQAVGAPSGGIDPVTNTHQDTADRQAGNGQHQRLAQALQKSHHK